MSEREPQNACSELVNVMLWVFLNTCVCSFDSQLDFNKYAVSAQLCMAKKHPLPLLDSTYWSNANAMPMHQRSTLLKIQETIISIHALIYFTMADYQQNYGLSQILSTTVMQPWWLFFYELMLCCVINQWLHRAPRHLWVCCKMSRQFPAFLANLAPPLKKKELIRGGDKAGAQESHDTDAGNNLRVNYLGFWAVSLYTICLCSPPAFYDSPH